MISWAFMLNANTTFIKKLIMNPTTPGNNLTIWFSLTRRVASQNHQYLEWTLSDFIIFTGEFISSINSSIWNGCFWSLKGIPDAFQSACACFCKDRNWQLFHCPCPWINWDGREIPLSLWESLALKVSTKGSRSQSSIAWVP